MKPAEIPHHFTVNMTPKEFDELLLCVRIYVRDYECSDLAKEMLAALEEAGGNREVGGQTVWEPDGWHEPHPDDEEEEGGAVVAA